MLDSIMTGTEITLYGFFACTAASLLLGLGIALLCMYKSSYTQSFVITLAMLPSVVQVIIMLVNGNIGTGVAVAGAFGLVRFRSTPGTAKEIGMIFLAMAIGLANGMGYVILAALFFMVMAAFVLVLSRLRFGCGDENERELKITIPENLDYEGLFDDLFQRYVCSARLERVKTSNMGTLYELDYRVVLKASGVPKEFLDELRCRNGNLNIVCGRTASREAL
ncbi:DUF4956 domain-containing protein [Flintibacter muris]|uniref:DUF4956 domain-containing protein n=1 Tax=Flintibacter muris TaxID=2941327 RepID=UPI00203B6B35|nr:DUF4956 domain-containing protein [Flintibacter muris]